MRARTLYPEFPFLNDVHDESESQKTRAEGKKPGRGKCGLYDFIYTECKVFYSDKSQSAVASGDRPKKNLKGTLAVR